MSQTLASTSSHWQPIHFPCCSSWGKELRVRRVHGSTSLLVESCSTSTPRSRHILTYCAKAVAETVKTTCKPQVYTYFRKEIHKKQTNLCGIIRKGSSRTLIEFRPYETFHFKEKKRGVTVTVFHVWPLRHASSTWGDTLDRTMSMRCIHDGAGSGRRCSISSSQIY